MCVYIDRIQSFVFYDEIIFSIVVFQVLGEKRIVLGSSNRLDIVFVGRCFFQWRKDANLLTFFLRDEMLWT